jgi:hypothetical protein
MQVQVNFHIIDRLNCVRAGSIASKVLVPYITNILAECIANTAASSQFNSHVLYIIYPPGAQFSVSFMWGAGKEVGVGCCLDIISFNQSGRYWNSFKVPLR